MPATLQRARASTSSRQQTINIRAQQQQVALIDQAAAAEGQTRSAFMLDHAIRAAEEIVLDKLLFAVDEATYNRFRDRLDAPVRSDRKLRSFLEQRAPWDK